MGTVISAVTASSQCLVSHRSVSKVKRQHNLSFSNSPLNNSGEAIGFGEELGESLSPDTVIVASLLRPTSVEPLHIANTHWYIIYEVLFPGRSKFGSD